VYNFARSPLSVRVMAAAMYRHQKGHQQYL
jgi:hypothetical protein